MRWKTEIRARNRSHTKSSTQKTRVTMEHCGDNNDDNDDMSMEDIEDEEEEEDEEEMEDDGIPEEDAALARRQTILAVMRDRSLSETERNGRIQAIMTGNRQVVVEEQAPEDGVAGLPDPAVATTTTTTACVHYERNCSVVAPCCGKIVGCRICHDELSPQGHPPMNRFLIREVVCKNCNVRQPCSYVLWGGVLPHVLWHKVGLNIPHTLWILQKRVHQL